MQVNVLTMTMLQETEEMLSSMLRDAPNLSLNYKATVELYASTDLLPELPSDTICLANAHNLNIWYDARLGRSVLMLSLRSESIQNVYDWLSKEEQVPYAWEGVPPCFFLPFSTNVPPSERRVNAWIDSVGTMFFRNSVQLLFGHPIVEVVELDAIPFFEYRKAQASDPDFLTF